MGDVSRGVKGHDFIERLDPCSLQGLPPGRYRLRSNVTDTVCLGKGDPKKLGDNCQVTKEPPNECNKPSQCGATLVGLSAGPVWVLKTCDCNAHNALCNRHGVKQPPVTRDFRNYAQFIPTVLVEAEYLSNLPTVRETWINKWPKDKQKNIDRSLGEDFPDPSRVKCMVKRELAHKEPTKARAIQFYADLATQAHFGPEYYALQKAYCSVFNRYGDRIRVTFASGMDSPTLGSWMKTVLDDYCDPWFYERDGKTWDATMSDPHHELKTHAYRFMGNEFLAFHNKAKDVRGRVRSGKFAYQLKGTTKSGHNDTSLGNSLVNAGVAYEACLEQGLRADIIVMGDDLLVVVEGDFDEHRFAKVESELGIVPEYRKFDSVEDVTFLSAIWIPGVWLFVPVLGRLLVRAFWTVKPPPKKHTQAFASGIAKGLLPTLHSIPVAGPFLKAHCKAIDSYINQPIWDFYTKYQRYDRADVIEWFKRRYDFLECEITEVERLFTTNEPRILVHPLIDKILTRDLVDIDCRPTVGRH